jgi:hypothetical protein
MCVTERAQLYFGFSGVSKLLKYNENALLTPDKFLLHVVFYLLFLEHIFLPLGPPTLIVSDYTSAATTLVTSVFAFISALLTISMINMYDFSC